MCNANFGCGAANEKPSESGSDRTASMGIMGMGSDPGNLALRADAEEFWPSSESRGSYSSQLFRHASDHMPSAQEGRYMSRQVRRHPLPQVQIESQKTLNRLDAVPFTPGNGVLTPTQSNMAMLWYQAQPGTPMTPYQPSPVQYQAVPASPGWQMMVPAQSAGYWSPMQLYPSAAMQYWHPLVMPSHAAYSPEHARHGSPHWQPTPPPYMPTPPQARQPPLSGSSPRTLKQSSPGSSPKGHGSANGAPNDLTLQRMGRPCRSNINFGIGLDGLRRPSAASASNDSRFAAAVCQNYDVLAEAAAKDIGDGGSMLQSRVKELEILMAVQGVHAAPPSKASEESVLLHSPNQGNGHHSGKGHIVGPKMKAAAASHTSPSPALSDVRVKRDSTAYRRGSDDRREGSDKSGRTPLLNARSRRSLRRAIQRAIDEAARSGVQLSTELDDLPQLNSSPLPV